jgi:hypothetical protein
MYSLEQFVSPELLEELLSFSPIVSMLSGIPGMLISLATYIVVSLSLYTIADRRDIKHAWLAWIPVGNLWILGSISDHYQLNAAFRTKNKRKLLMILQILLAILCVIMLVMVVVTVLAVFEAGGNSQYEHFIDVWAPARDSLLELVLVWLAMMAVAIWTTVVQYMALYDVYKSCEPGNATLYLVLSIVVNVTQPIFLFLCRNKDAGLPSSQIPPASFHSPESPTES